MDGWLLGWIEDLFSFHSRFVVFRGQNDKLT